MNIPVILFGSVPLAAWAASKLLAHDGFDLEGVVCEKSSNSFAHHGLDHGCVYDLARRVGIPILDLGSLRNRLDGNKRYLGISVRFSKIIKKDIIGLFKRGIINLHAGELPRYRGVHIANHCILDGATRAGGTLHYIDEGVDTGDIIDRELYPIGPTHTAFDLFRQTQDALCVLFERNLDRMAADDLPRISQQAFIDQGETTRTYKKNEIEMFRQLDLNMPTDEIARRVRAFDFPGHEPAYFEIEGLRVYATVRTP